MFFEIFFEAEEDVILGWSATVLPVVKSMKENSG